MKLLYAARIARFDLLRSTNTLARHVTKWSVQDDAKLYHLIMCYANSTLGKRMIGWVGNDMKDWSMACDGSGGTEGDVNMDKDEIDRLVKATKAKTEAQGNEDVDMTGASSSGPASYGNGQPSRPTPKPKTTLEAAEKEKKEAEDERQAEEEEEENKRQENVRKMPAWATRIVPGCLMHCVDVCHGK